MVVWKLAYTSRSYSYTNLSTACIFLWKACSVQKFQAEETVSTKYCKGPQTLMTDRKRLLWRSLLLLREIIIFGGLVDQNRYTAVSESAICKFFSVRTACKSQHKALVDHSPLQILPGYEFPCSIETVIAHQFTCTCLHIATLYDCLSIALRQHVFRLSVNNENVRA